MQTTDLVICLGVALGMWLLQQERWSIWWGGGSESGQRKVWAVESNYFSVHLLVPLSREPQQWRARPGQRNAKTRISFVRSGTFQPAIGKHSRWVRIIFLCGLVSVYVHRTAGIKWGGKFSANFHVANLYPVIREETIYCTKRRRANEQSEGGILV